MTKRIATYLLLGVALVLFSACAKTETEPEPMPDATAPMPDTSGSAESSGTMNEGGAAEPTTIDYKSRIGLYACPMHATSTSMKAGEKCPECGMDLEPVQKFCPVSGQPIAKEFSVEQDGKTIYFCCADCPKDFAKDPATYMAKLEAGAGEKANMAPGMEGMEGMEHGESEGKPGNEAAGTKPEEH